MRQYEIKSEVHSDKALLNVWAQCPTCERQCSGATALQRWRCEFVPDKNTQIYTSTSGMWACLLITHRFFKISVDAVDLSWGNTLGYRQGLSSVLFVTGLEYAALRRTDRKWGKLPAYSLNINTVSLLAQGLRKHWSNAPFKQILSSFCMSYDIIMHMWWFGNLLFNFFVVVSISCKTFCLWTDPDSEKLRRKSSSMSCYSIKNHQLPQFWCELKSWLLIHNLNSLFMSEGFIHLEQ